MGHCQVFRDDEQILRFIHNVQEFSNFNVSFQEEGKEYQGKGNQSSNPVPCGLVALEFFFDRQDRHKNKKETSKVGDYTKINIGTDKDPKLIKIGKGTSKKEMNELINLIKEYRDVLAFSYDELKAYREDVFQHTIPLNKKLKK